MIFTLCGYHDITLWHLRSGNELVRIEVPNVTCLCVCFNLSRTEMISGWSDGKIRSFGPDVSTFLKSSAIVSGGSEGQVRLWKLGRDSQQLVATMKEHNIPVTAVRITQYDLECVSNGSDGQMLTWYEEVRDMFQFIYFQINLPMLNAKLLLLILKIRDSEQSLPNLHPNYRLDQSVSIIHPRQHNH
ncbi:MAG: putative flagellar associated protein [Streblomastix strix]|uniref:Putative flagellar associated protein n=1 Tax=Streblomastix strix TaxID=222440 RepID=A0A5J4TEY2_9EUKA|nr:MAG: putative flagellar associated protein [Streblomastix strix]